LVVGGVSGFISGGVAGYLSGGWQGAAAGAVVGTISGAGAGALTGFVNPFGAASAGNIVAGAVGGAVGDVMGQLLGQTISGQEISINPGQTVGAAIGGGAIAGVGALAASGSAFYVQGLTSALGGIALSPVQGGLAYSGGIIWDNSNNSLGTPQVFPSFSPVVIENNGAFDGCE